MARNQRLTVRPLPAHPSNVAAHQRYGFGSPNTWRTTAPQRYFFVRGTAPSQWAGRAGSARARRFQVPAFQPARVRPPRLEARKRTSVSPTWSPPCPNPSAHPRANLPCFKVSSASALTNATRLLSSAWLCSIESTPARSSSTTGRYSTRCTPCRTPCMGLRASCRQRWQCSSRRRKGITMADRTLTRPKEKAAPAGTGTASSTAFSARHDTATPDPLKGWFALAGNVKPSRNRPQKRGWLKGGRR
jgi:hypothetical protein